MLHDRILVLVSYVKDVLSGMPHYLLRCCHLIPLSGTTPKDHATIRSLAALIASLPASDSQGFRDEFETVPKAFVQVIVLPNQRLMIGI
jgi:COP9 signalosome complex subunit 6